MKDAKGHGSDPRGAHTAGVQQVGQPLYHGSPKAAQIKRQGFSLDTISKNSGSLGITGTGVYVTSDPKRAALYGTVLDVGLAPGLKLFQPTDTLVDLFGSHTNYGDPDKIANYYRSKGYDGIKIAGQGGHQTAVIFDPKNVKVR